MMINDRCEHGKRYRDGVCRCDGNAHLGAVAEEGRHPLEVTAATREATGGSSHTPLPAADFSGTPEGVRCGSEHVWAQDEEWCECGEMHNCPEPYWCTYCN